MACLLWFFCAWTGSRLFGADLEISDEALWTTAGKALSLLEQSSAVALEQRACFTCHHGSFPVTALQEAWSLGFPVGEKNLEDQLLRTLERLRANVERRQKDLGQQGDINGEVDAAGHSLWMLDLAGYPHDAITGGTASILLEEQNGEGFWTPALHRPPTVGSPFTSTFVALRGILAHADSLDREKVQASGQRALHWLESTAASDTEDRVYRLRALGLLDRDGAAFQSQLQEILGGQFEDGGWPQAFDWRRDAYATGTILAALRDTDAIPVRHPAFQRGLRFLLETQDATGAWHVRNRTAPVQPFFSSGFPFKRDQFISIAGTSWAAYALLVSMEAPGDLNRPAFAATRPALASFGQSRSHGWTEGQVAFFRSRIQPILENRCVSCHESRDGGKRKAGLALDHADALRAGGENGPVLDAMNPERGLLLRSVLGQEEGLERMPPKEPLSQEEIDFLRDWVLQGAPDPRF